MTAYLVSKSPDLVFGAPDQTAEQLRADVGTWIAEGRMMTVSGVDAAGDEASTVISWGDITDFTIGEDEPGGGAIVLTDIGED